MNHKFDSLHGLDFNDQQKEIADKFAKLVFDKPGWYRGTIDYMLDENGKVVRIDGLKVTMTGAELPTEVFSASRLPQLEAKPCKMTINGIEATPQIATLTPTEFVNACREWRIEHTVEWTNYEDKPV